MTRRLAVFDFDSTLFDMLSFIPALCQAVEEMFGIDAQAFESALKRFYVKNAAGSLVGYDIDAHLLSHGIDLSESDTEVVLANKILAVHKRLTGRSNLLFSDVAPMIRRLAARGDTDIVILTVNLLRGYQFKLLLCGTILAGITALVVQENKGMLVSRLWAGGIVWDGVRYTEALVVDDHPEQISAVTNAPNVERVQIVRPGQRYPANQHGVRTAATLDELSWPTAA